MWMTIAGLIGFMGGIIVGNMLTKDSNDQINERLDTIMPTLTEIVTSVNEIKTIVDDTANTMDEQVNATQEIQNDIDDLQVKLQEAIDSGGGDLQPLADLINGIKDKVGAMNVTATTVRDNLNTVDADHIREDEIEVP